MSLPSAPGPTTRIYRAQGAPFDYDAGTPWAVVIGGSNPIGDDSLDTYAYGAEQGYEVAAYLPAVDFGAATMAHIETCFATSTGTLTWFEGHLHASPSNGDPVAYLFSTAEVVSSPGVPTWAQTEAVSVADLAAGVVAPLAAGSGVLGMFPAPASQEISIFELRLVLTVEPSAVPYRRIHPVDRGRIYPPSKAYGRGGRRGGGYL